MTETSVIQVFVFRDGNYVGNEVFTEPEIVIGHGEGVDLSLDDDQVSYNHALLSHENGQATLLKLGAGSVMINRTEVEHSYVTPRDEIQIGSHTLKIKFLTPKSQQPSKAPVPSNTRSPSPATPWDPNPNAPPQVVSRAQPPAAAKKRIDPAMAVQMSAAFSEELTAEQLTERIDTKAAPLPQPSVIGRKSSPSVSLFEEKTFVPDDRRQPAYGTEESDPSIPFAVRRPGGQPSTGSIEITGSDVLAVRAVSTAADSGSLEAKKVLPEPGLSSAGLDAVWDDSQPEDAVDFGRLHADHLEMALDAAFTGAPPPSKSAPASHKPLATDLKIPKPRLPISPQSPIQPIPYGAPPDRGFVLSPTVPSIATAPEMAVSPIDFLPEVEDKTAPRPHPTFTPPAKVSVSTPHPAVEHDLDEDLDEYEIEERIRPDYSLVDVILRSAAAANVAVLDPRQSLEIIAFTKDGVRATALLKEKNAKFVLGKTRRGMVAPQAGHPGLKLAKLLQEGSAEIAFPSSAQGFVQTPDRRIGLDDLKVPDNAVAKTGDTYRTEIRAGSFAVINLDEMSFHLRFVRPPAMPKDRKGFAIDRHITRSFYSSVGLHLVVAFLIGILAPGVSYSEAAREVWSDPVHDPIRDVEIKPDPPKPPEPEPVKEVKAPEPVKETPPPRTVKPPRDRKKERRVAAASDVPPPQREDIKTVGVLGAMGKLNLAAPGRKSMVQAVSNIEAVRAPGGSNYRMGQLIGKLPSSEISVGGGGGGPPLTRGGASLIRGGDGFAAIGKRDEGKVRGSVTQASARHVEAKGSISREEVAAVINAHLREVQYCYEKTLLKDPGLTGKLVLEWTIDTNGAVSRVKQNMSTLRNPAVSSCISASLKRWTFPKPRGGIVIVSYPFIFNAVGF